MLSIFKKSVNLEGIVIRPRPLHLTSTPQERGIGVTITLPVRLCDDAHLNSTTKDLKFFVDTDTISKIAEQVGIPERIIEVPAPKTIKRRKYCKNGHRLLALNIIHWPNGAEECRCCYMEREAAEEAAKSGKAVPRLKREKPAPVKKAGKK